MNRAFALLSFLAAGLAPAVALADAPFDLAKTPGKLPKNVVPVAYSIDLRTNVKAFTFSGAETVSVRVMSATSKIVVNTHDVRVSTAAVDGKGAANIATDNRKQITTLTLNSALQPGTHSVRMTFTGKIGEQPEGLFYTKYSTASGPKIMLASQMESTDARRMFPSWDEPVFRATYSLRVTVPKRFDAVSNMPATAQTVSGDQKTVSFAPTPKMASYLVVLCAGEFGYLKGSSDGINVRIVAPKGREATGRYALESAEKLLAYYNDYFGIKYPLPKLDLIAVPGGFPGAMENWGGITFTQDALLFDPAVEPDSARIGVFETIAHEMSHQWFGDLVTMAWWDNLWLNEGFADWMQTKASDHFNPSWHLWERVNGDVEEAMQTDGQFTTHPVQTAVADETQADAAFDEITYQKGGAFIRMTEGYLGEDTFRDGIRQYMRENAYSNTTSANLYAALGAASHRDVASFAKAWTIDPGFPLVSVDESCSGGRAKLDLTQQRFFYEPNQSSQQLWQIPLRIAGAFSPNAADTMLMTTRTDTQTGGECGQPALVNAGAVGYYRVQYDAATTRQLTQGVEQMTPPDRVRVVADTHALIVAQKAEPSAYLDLVARLGNDSNLAVWTAALDGLDAIASYQIGHPGAVAFDAYRRQTLRPVFDRVGGWSLEGADPTSVSLKRRLINSLGDAGDAQIIGDARTRYEAFRTDPKSLSPDLRSAVLNVVGMYADTATWNDLHARVKKSKSVEEATMYVSALCHARDASLAQRCLQMGINGDIPEEAGPVTGLFDLVTVAQSGRQPKLAWQFYRTNSAALTKQLSQFERTLIAARMFPLFWNAAPVAELEAYAKANLPPSPQTTQGLHQMELIAQTAARVAPAVDQWVVANGFGAKPAAVK